MTLRALSTSRFVRKTRLGPDEYRKNFHQIDREVMTAVTSEEADQVTPLMSKIYLRLVNAPDRYWEREGVLRIEAEVREEKLVKAWAVLCEMVGVASATASKALRWMREQGIIGYFAGKNGAGIRVFLNRAASSIGSRGGPGREKILDFSRGSSREHCGSRDEPAFNDPSGVSEGLDTDSNPRAPFLGADKDAVVKKGSAQPPLSAGDARPESPATTDSPSPAERCAPNPLPVDEIVNRLKRELESKLLTAARQAAASEHERTREWLDRQGIPKAARVAQKEAYDVLRSHGLVNPSARRGATGTEAGRAADFHAPPDARSRTPAEINELAESCVALWEAQGKPVEATLAEIGSASGGWLPPKDASLVGEAARRLTAERSRRESMPSPSDEPTAPTTCL